MGVYRPADAAPRPHTQVAHRLHPSSSPFLLPHAAAAAHLGVETGRRESPLSLAITPTCPSSLHWTTSRAPRSPLPTESIPANPCLPPHWMPPHSPTTLAPQHAQLRRHTWMADVVHPTSASPWILPHIHNYPSSSTLFARVSPPPRTLARLFPGKPRPINPSHSRGG